MVIAMDVEIRSGGSAYRAKPDAPVGELRHHDPETVTGLAGNLTPLLWKDIVAQVVEVLAADD